MNKVDYLIKKYKTRNPICLAEHLGIIVLHESLGTINGYYNTAFRQKFIHINQELPDHLKVFITAHELGHALLHPNSNTPFMKECTYLSVDKIEIEANSFAINLLISNDELKEYKDFTIEQLARLYGYHEKIIELRLRSSR